MCVESPDKGLDASPVSCLAFGECFSKKGGISDFSESMEQGAPNALGDVGEQGLPQELAAVDFLLVDVEFLEAGPFHQKMTAKDLGSADASLESY
jgi:hypothetical protein